MRKQIIIPVLTLALVLPFSCKKKNNQSTNTDSTPTTTGSSSSPCTGPVCYNDGVSISADSAQAVLYTATGGTLTPHRHIDVYVFKGGNQVLELHFLPKTGAQTVLQDFSGAWLTYITNGGFSSTDYYNCSSGNFNLTTCDTVANKLNGSFDFTGNNGSSNKSIVSGVINITKIKKM